MTDFFRLISLCYAAAAALFCFCWAGATAAALFFIQVSALEKEQKRSFKKNLQKFNFFEIVKLYYNYMVREFALKAKSFFFWKGKFEGEWKNYFMIKAKAIFCMGFLFISFVALSKENTSVEIEKYSQLLNSESAKDRLDAVYALAVSSDIRAEEMLISTYKIERDAYIKTQIIEALSVKNSTQAAFFIVEATEDKNPEIRKTAWNSINEIAMAKPEIASIVRENFKKEGNVSVKFAALRAFCMDNSTTTVKEISSFVMDGKEDKELRKAALKKLSKIKSKIVKSELNRISRAKEKDIASEAKKLLENK